jgi:hypothetical protein
MNDFPRQGSIESGHHPPHVGVVGQDLDAREDFVIPIFDPGRQE